MDSVAWNVSLTYLRVLEVKQLYKVEGLIRYQSPDWFYLLVPLVVEGLAIPTAKQKRRFQEVLFPDGFVNFPKNRTGNYLIKLDV